MVFIVEISLEQLLCSLILKVLFMVLNSLCIFPFLVVNMVLIKVLFRLIWAERCFHAFLDKCIPVKVTEPWMILYFLISVES